VLNRPLLLLVLHYHVVSNSYHYAAAVFILAASAAHKRAPSLMSLSLSTLSPSTLLPLHQRTLTPNELPYTICQSGAHTLAQAVHTAAVRGRCRTTALTVAVSYCSANVAELCCSSADVVLLDAGV
jgi:hypothetical protein